jgi:DNA-binding MarR family transcriptional regulator
MGKPGGAAFLLAQLGAHAAERFAQRIAVLQITPPIAGILGQLAAGPGLSQQDLANRLGMLPSRLVAFVDDLESRGLVRRVRDDADRRRNSLQLTEDGRAMLNRIGKLAREHETETCAALSEREREQFARLLGRMAAEQGLTPGVHPGYRTLRARS